MHPDASAGEIRRYNSAALKKANAIKGGKIGNLGKAESEMLKTEAQLSNSNSLSDIQQATSERADALAQENPGLKAKAEAKIPIEANIPSLFNDEF